MRFLAVILVSLLIIGCAQNNYTTYKSQYEQMTFNDAPDYSNLDSWAAHPQKKDPSDSLPNALAKNFHPIYKVDVFFIHPTTYLDTAKPYGWNASLKDVKTNISTDFGTILNQASVFNEVGLVYAPRYRQAHIGSYSPIGHADTVKALAAFELAYQDVKAAFDYYLAHYNNGKPIVIASHSQGSTHAKRLLKEYFDDKPLGKKLVAAYVVGMAINPADYTQLKPCSTPHSIGCICAWRTYKEGYVPAFVEKENYTSIVTNPLSWSDQVTQVDRKNNKGSVLYNFKNITPKVAGAINHNGILWTPKPQFFGNFLYNTPNYHIADYNLYYLSVRQNVAERVQTYLSKGEHYSTNN
jgi:hypothetical protein